MDKIIYYVVECDTLYGVVALAILLIGFTAPGFIAYKALKEVFLYIYKIICKTCNTSKNYKDVHTKVGVKDVSFENEFHQ